MALLEIQSTNESAATLGRFFVDENFMGSDYHDGPKSVYWHDEMFWLEHSTYLHDKPATILQFGLNGEDVVDLKEPHKSVVTLEFDHTARSLGRFAWGLTKTDVYGPGTLYRLDVYATTLVAQKHAYDAQGVKRKTTELDPAPVAHAIGLITGSELLADKIASYNNDREKSEIELSKLAVMGIQKFSAESHQKRLADIEKRIAKIGFTPTVLRT